jgi:hypothetical protein
MTMTIRKAVAAAQDRSERAAAATVTWRKSSHSNHFGNCVELAEHDAGTVAFRDSKDPCGAVLVFPRGEAAMFIAAVAEGTFGA